MTCPPPRVLILEDHAFQRSVAVSMFRQAGCREVFEACDGAQALAILQEVGPVDIALCDLQMEGMDGLEFFRRLGASGQVRSIIISSSLSADLRRAVHQIVSLLGLELHWGMSANHCTPQALRELLDKHPSHRPVTCAPATPLLLASEEEVNAALALGQIQSWYQPKFHLHTGQVCGVEVLSRWLHPQRGVLSPAVYLPILERNGQMDRLLFAQLEQALMLQRTAASRGFTLNMAFNLQSTQLADSELTASIRRLLLRHGMPGSGLTFELTESGLLQAPATSLENLVRLRMMGCRLSIDDFGAGFSSLQRLCQLPFNEIKLDAEFVRGLAHEPRCRAAITSTLALGDSLGMSVVIEGIETDAQRLHLMSLGCVQGQGYWFARPMSGEDLLAWLQLHGQSPGGR